jgi:hypothetical protein
MTGLCPACLAPIPVEHNRITAHREQIVTAYGWGDGYTACAGSGRTPRHDFQPETKETARAQ